MPNDGTGAAWDEAAPSNSGVLSQGPQEIRDLRKGVRSRIKKEHKDLAGSTTGGEHLAGSAVMFVSATIAPTKRPDTTTDLDSNDVGRLWLNTDTMVVKVWSLDPADSTYKWMSIVPGASVTLASEKYAKIVDKKALGGSASGTFTSGAWRTRTLQTPVHDAGSIISALSGNRFTLAAGTYRFRIRCPAYIVDRHQARLFDVTNNAEIAEGTSEYSDSGAGFVQSWSEIIGRMTIAGSTQFEVQHLCQTTRTTNGFGVDTANYFTGVSFPGVVVDSVYTTVEIWKEL